METENQTAQGVVITSLPLPGGIADLPLATIPVNFDFVTGAVVSLVLMLLGMAAALLLMLKFTGKTVERNQ